MHMSFLVFLVLAACGAPVVPSGDAGTDAGPAPVVDAGWPDAGTPPDAGTLGTVLRVTYPAGTQALFVRGSKAPLSWNTGVPMQKVDATTWTLSLPTLAEALEWKPLLDDATWSKGPNYRAAVGATVEVAPRFFRDIGEWSVRWPTFTSTVLGNTRGVYVYLPPTYLENGTARMPVVYMHDGQNLFDPAASFGGVTWAVADAMNAAAGDGSFREAIVVGPENAGAARIDEYTPTADPSYGGGHGDAYVQMLITELKPRVDAELRTKPGREDTVLIGSSLGGLISSYAGIRHADVFGSVGAMSPSVWWDSKVLLTLLPQTGAVRPLRAYVDIGTAEGSSASSETVADAAALVAGYEALGYVRDSTVKYVVQPGAMHTESAWASRLPGALQFLLGPRP